MLEPRVRRLFLDALRPPDGYALDHAIGTTYTLDLLALLTAPLAFTLFDAEAPVVPGEGSVVAPLALLTALRRHAEQITLFCQAGQISVPARHQLLFSYLEPCVHEARALSPGHAFHPKLWLLRFVREKAPVRYRLLCSSRNLTFDRSWDTLLTLDGELPENANDQALNHPLAYFFEALPGLAVHRPLPPAVIRAIERAQDETRRILWESPPDMELKGFWPLGIPGARGWPFQGRMGRLLVVSPFVSPGCLTRLTAEGTGNVLVSRPESLLPLPPEQLAGFANIYQLSPSADPDEAGGETGQSSGAVLAGLHAKFYLAETGRQARLWTGSANATDAAFSGNVEFLVELEGRKGQCGIDALLRQGCGCDTFAGLLLPFRPEEQVTPPDLLQELEQELDAVRRLLAAAGLRAILSPHSDPGTYCLAVTRPTGGPPEVRMGVESVCWPISLPEAAGQRLTWNGPALAEFERVSLEGITGFFAFSLTARAADRQARTRFVLNLPLEGAPADRRERLLHSLLRDRSQVLRLLRFLLAEGGGDAAALLAEMSGTDTPSTDGERAGADLGIPVFESLVRALDRNPGKLDEVARLVDELSRTPEGQALLPQEFHNIWAPIREARARYRK